LLVFVDSLSRWIEATPLNTDPTSEQVLHAYLSDVVCRHGTPRELRSDSGSNFVRDLTSTILKLTGTDLTPTEAHHHEGVGLVERAQQTLVALARATNEGGAHWADHLPFFLMSMRASPNRLTSQSPALLLYGRELRLPSQIGDPRTVADVTALDDLPAPIPKYAELLHNRLLTLGQPLKMPHWSLRAMPLLTRRVLRTPTSHFYMVTESAAVNQVTLIKIN